MPVEVILPKVDMDMATGRITRWHVKEGAEVKKGDVLFEIETDKAAMEIDAPASGVIRDISGKEGVDIPVGQAVAWIYSEGEAPATIPAKETSEAAPEIGESAPGAESAASEESVPASLSPVLDTKTPADAKMTPSGVRATPLARRLAREAGLDLSAIVGSGPHGRVVKADVEKALEAGTAAPAPAIEAAEAKAQPAPL